ncbi:beta-lactamase/transpeptidase-like protein [Hyaloraphidium curvatum]|nr:beta-lactamase/transpeptidase-like protein [Hyaloraphidium curvatum]
MSASSASGAGPAVAAALGAAALASLSLARSGAHATTVPSLTFNTLGRPTTYVGGYVAPGYEAVLDAYRANFEAGDEVGSTLTIMVKGRKVVDLHGGWTDASFKTPYSGETVNVVFSAGKAVETFVALYCISKGHFKLEDKIASIWPEFDAGGKEDVTVEDLLAHRGGVAWLDKDRNTVSVVDMREENLGALADRIAGQPHNFPGGNKQAYHAITRGWYLNEIIRRQTGMSMGRIWREVLNPLLGTEIFVGLPEEEQWRRADLVAYPLWKTVTRQYLPGAVTGQTALPVDPSHQEFLRNPRAYLSRGDVPPRILIMMTSPRMPPPHSAVPFPERCNLPSYTAGEGTSFCTVTNARSLAKVAAVLAAGGTAEVRDPVGGGTKAVRLVDPGVLEAALEMAPDLGPDVNLGPSMPPLTRCGFGRGQGYRVPNSFRGDDGAFRPKDSDWDWMGWDGMGGNMCVFERTRGIAVGYAVNGLHPGGGWNDRRLGRVLEAFAACFDKAEGRSKL